MEWYYWVLIGVAVVALVSFKAFRTLIYQLVVMAEKTIVGDKVGAERYKYVAERIYAVLPKTFQVIFTPSVISKLIEKAVIKMKEELDKEAIKDKNSNE